MIHEKNKINNILFLNGKDGSRLTFKVLFTYYSETLNKDYAVFYNEDDEENLIAFSFTDCNNLNVIQGDEEYKELEKALEEFDNR
jgi:uncharacterized protein YrzB (UPF0473 family)